MSNSKSLMKLKGAATIMAFVISSAAFASEAKITDAEYKAEADKMYSDLMLERVLPRVAFEDGFIVASRSEFSNGKLAVIDYTKHSSEKRFHMFDVKEHSYLGSTYVAHGSESGSSYANEFSNEVGSNKTSLGFYVAHEDYYGKNKHSIRMDGMSIGLNDNARKRAITMHASNYANPEYIKFNKRLGRSDGCFALPQDGIETIINRFKFGGIVYAYHDNKTR